MQCMFTSCNMISSVESEANKTQDEENNIEIIIQMII